ncbi:MAG TPA: DUF5684 domain-containing protein [Candidatus Polarisedimenticolia bacterium]|nr:DUF5684 domain-containing protein [Candidatus Polarisedimenticolia bacterium]
MKRAEYYRCLGQLLILLVLLLVYTSASAKPGEMTLGDKEQTFPVLQTKTGAYTNVTVTKKTKDWIFIMHSAGVCNVKASDLSTEARIALGYEAAPAKGNGVEIKADNASAEAASANGSPSNRPHFKINLSKIKQFAADWRQNRKEKMAALHAYLSANTVMVCSILGIWAAVHIITSALFWMICRKTHISPGPLVWVPVFQLIPLLRAANMSWVWFFAFLIFPLNIIAMIVFSIKIVKSRGKSPWVAFLLILPPTSGIAFLYLAFSSSAPVQMESNEVLALETA